MWWDFVLISYCWFDQKIHRIHQFFGTKFYQDYSIAVSIVPLIGGRWYIITQLAVSTTYILPIGWLYITYHLLREPGNSIELYTAQPPKLAAGTPKYSLGRCFSFFFDEAWVRRSVSEAKKINAAAVTFPRPPSPFDPERIFGRLHGHLNDRHQRW